jgi:GNAT superfamily N-acetyltransferase
MPASRVRLLMSNITPQYPMSARPAIDVTFRVAVDADALCIGVLATQVFLDSYATDGIRPSLAREVLEHLSTNAVSALLSNPNARFIVAERAGHMIAFAQLTCGSTQELVPSGTTGELNRLYVQEPFTRMGIGTVLLHRAEAMAASEGTSTMWLTGWVGNRRALAFYASRGYKDLGATTYVFENEQYENRVLAKALHGPDRDLTLL